MQSAPSVGHRLENCILSFKVIPPSGKEQAGKIPAAPTLTLGAGGFALVCYEYGGKSRIIFRVETNSLSSIFLIHVWGASNGVSDVVLGGNFSSFFAVFCFKRLALVLVRILHHKKLEDTFPGAQAGQD